MVSKSVDYLQKKNKNKFKTKTKQKKNKQKKSGYFHWTVNGNAILVCLSEILQNKWNVLRGSPKFPTGISKQKLCSFNFFLSVPGHVPVVKLVPDSL